ncbi:hypothetical protein AmDm5_1367 [Acetobacter malorum]|nr:hypothetical protein AmDm5_1367 [Acetobacter malorum]
MMHKELLTNICLKCHVISSWIMGKESRFLAGLAVVFAVTCLSMP